MRCCQYLVIFAMVAMPLAHAGKFVEMYTDDAYAKKVKRRKLDCDIHGVKSKSLTLGFKLSIPFILSVGPEIKFGQDCDKKWNDTSQELIRRYEELCDMHNKGLLTVAEFNKRYQDLDTFYEKTLKLKEDLVELVQKRANEAFAELDEEPKKQKLAQEIQKQADALTVKIDEVSVEAKNLAEPTPVPEDKRPKKGWLGSKND